MKLLAMCILASSVLVSCNRDKDHERDSSPLDVFKPDPVEVIKSPGKVTMESYERLSNGMTYEDACVVMGGAGEEISSSNIGDIVTAAYVWRGPDNTSINVVVQGGKVVMKSKFGLR